MTLIDTIQHASFKIFIFMKNIKSNLSTAKTKFGHISYYRNDDPIGVALERYGEWAGVELAFISRFIKNGDVVIDIGANIGTHTIALARMVGDSGFVYSFEPQPDVFSVLAENISENRISNVKAFNSGAGARREKMYCEPINYDKKTNIGAASLKDDGRGDDLPVDVFPIDDLKLASCSFVKIDAEGMEVDVLAGLEGVINLYRPLIFVECNHVGDGYKIMSSLESSCYEFYLIATMAYNKLNIRNNAENFFGYAREISLFCVPEGMNIPVTLPMDGCSVHKVDDSDGFAILHLAVPRFGDKSENERDICFLRDSVRNMNDKLTKLVENEVIMNNKLTCANEKAENLQQDVDAANLRVLELEGELRRLSFRNKSLLVQIGLLSAQRSDSSALTPPDVQRLIERSSRNSTRRALSRWSANFVRDPLRRIRFKIINLLRG